MCLNRLVALPSAAAPLASDSFCLQGQTVSLYGRLAMIPHVLFSQDGRQPWTTAMDALEQLGGTMDALELE